MYEQLKREFEYYLANQKELVKEYSGKYIIIKDQIVICVYDDELEAIETTSKDHELGTFLVQKCELGVENYTQMYQSRVTFT